ncbi:MAG: hypothetical protein J0H29_12785 [Sphingobacteriales bacterium]|mgnify:FL=1|nr:hypothetical protein [Sphingobacteriales bacterium]OJY81822.1 MAG: hypothetical protein BGP14_03390 [Sphingobacteriales bacterium 44-15]
MNNTFSFSRLGLLIKKQWFDNSRLYILSALALIGLLTLIFTIWWLANRYDYRFSEASTNIIFLIVLFVSGLVFASTTFGMLGDKAKGIYWLNVPATALEKLVCGFFYSCFVFMILYITSFWLIKHITFFLIELNPKNELIRTTHNDIFERVVKPNLLYTFFALQALFMLGSVYFEKFSFIKTILIILFISFLFVMFCMFLGNNLLPPNFGVKGFSEFRVYDDNYQGTKIYHLASWIGDLIESLAKFIWVPVFLTVAYFRLKEKEI